MGYLTGSLGGQLAVAVAVAAAAAVCDFAVLLITISIFLKSYTIANRFVFHNAPFHISFFSPAYITNLDFRKLIDNQ
jgi:hypothetical protein